MRMYSQGQRLHLSTALPFVLLFFLLLIGLAWAVFLIWAIHFSDAQWAKILPGFADAESAFGPTPAGHISRIVAINLSLWTVILGFSALLLRFKSKLSQPEVRLRLIGVVVSIATACVLFYNLAARGWEAPWYHISEMMYHPEKVPVFGQRLLMIWPAVLLKQLIPRLSDIQSFIVIQGLGIIVAVYAVGEWSALFIGRELKFLGQILLALFLLPTADFFLGHDIAVVFTYCFCFLFLYQRRYAFFLIVFAIAIFNHQNVLLLIPTAVAVIWPVEKNKTIIWVGAAATVAYFSIQFFLNRTFPVPSTYEVKVWFNMRQIAELHRTMIFGAMVTIPWYAGAALAFKSADPFLKRASILLPMQLAIYSVFGQLNEARLFNGFLPILIGIYLCYIKARFMVGSDRKDKAEEFPAHVSALPQNLQRESDGILESADPELRGK